MTRSGLRIAIVSALVLAASVAIFFGFVTRNSTAAPCGTCGYSLGTTGHGEPPAWIVVAKVPIPKGTRAGAIDRTSLQWKDIPRSEYVADMSLDPRSVRNEFTIRTIPAGATLTAADFALRDPIYYARGYPKRVPADGMPAKIINSRYLPDNPYDFAVAPGVWVDGSSSEAALDAHVANGTLFGFCGPIRAFEAHNPDVQFASKCWRK